MAQCPAYRSSVILACLLPFVAIASAQDKPSSARRAAALHWVRLPGTEDCSGGDTLSRAVESKLRREVFPAPRDASVLIEGHVARAGSGYRAELQMRTPDGSLLGSRELSSEAADCSELSETIAVVLAVMIDPDAPTQTVATQPVSEPSATSGPPASAKQNDRDAQRLMGFARVALRLLPTDTLIGMGLAYELAWARWGGLRVEGVGFAIGREPLSGGDMLLQLGYAGLGYCPLWFTTGRLRSAACASGELGAMRAERASVRPQETKRNLWLSASLQARFALRLVGPLEAHLAGGISLPIKTFRYDAGPAGTIQVDGPLYGSIDIGLGARF